MELKLRNYIFENDIKVGIGEAVITFDSNNKCKMINIE
jgi:hypothetical protein